MSLNINLGLKDSEVASLKKGKFGTIADLVLTPTQDIAKRCRASPLDVKKVVNIVLQATKPPKLERLDSCGIHDQIFTTGDKTLDDALGGGIRTGMVWEVVGESAAGKTQFALQLSLFVQAPSQSGGLNASTCYLTTSSMLPTARLLQISETNEVLRSASCSLEHVHTLSTPTVALLQHVLTNMVPSFVQEQQSKENGKPIKLLVIDALAELFHSNDKTTSSTLVQRSRDLASISATLHELAKLHNLAILVLNEVMDSFDRHHQSKEQSGLSYNLQSRWFNTAEFFGERGKEANLGLVWANQVNTRIMLSRTGRRKYLYSEELPKRLRLNDSGQTSVPSSGQNEQQATLIRRLCVIFSNVCLPFSLDYIVTEYGISIIPNHDLPSIPSAGNLITIGQPTSSKNGTNPAISIVSGKTQQHMTEVNNIPDEIMGKPLEDANDHLLWENKDSTDNLDWDALEEVLNQALLKENQDSALGASDSE